MSGTVSGDEFAAISLLYARYNHAVDEGPPEAYADCFTPDGSVDIRFWNKRVRGRAALMAHKIEELQGREGELRRHSTASLYLEKTAENVAGRSYYSVHGGRPGEIPKLLFTGRYEDVVVFDRGLWRFSLRVILTD